MKKTFLTPFLFGTGCLGSWVVGSTLTQATPIDRLSTLASPAIASTVTSTAATGSTVDHVGVVEAIILGVVQGLTEFLPISSTAHLKVVPVILGFGDPGVAFTAFIQLGSILAVLGYFWKDLSEIFRGTLRAIADRNWQAHDFRLSLGIALGTLPIAIGGLTLKKLVPDFDHSPLRSIHSIAIASIVMALLLGGAEVLGKRQRRYQDLGMNDGIVMGFAQMLALIPGVSRSGSTLTAGLFTGIERAAAARFSFLLGIPAITLAGLAESVDIVRSGNLSASDFWIWGLGFLTATIVSYISIAWLLKFLQTQNTWSFVIYRLLFGVAILIGLGMNLLQNV